VCALEGRKSRAGRTYYRDRESLVVPCCDEPREACIICIIHGGPPTACPWAAPTPLPGMRCREPASKYLGQAATQPRASLRKGALLVLQPASHSVQVSAESVWIVSRNGKRDHTLVLDAIMASFLWWTGHSSSSLICKVRRLASDVRSSNS